MNYEPLKMRPCYKEYLWGGERLKREFHKVDAPAVTAESWELACHPDGMSAVADGPCVEAEPQACIYLGFSRRITREEFVRRAHEGTICEVLNRVSVSRGDVFYVLPGTIHGAGTGLVLAEVQQNSNTTFRIYDYKRTDRNGQARAACGACGGGGELRTHRTV